MALCIVCKKPTGFVTVHGGQHRQHEQECVASMRKRLRDEWEQEMQAEKSTILAEAEKKLAEARETLALVKERDAAITEQLKRHKITLDDISAKGNLVVQTLDEQQRSLKQLETKGDAIIQGLETNQKTLENIDRKTTVSLQLRLNYATMPHIHNQIVRLQSLPIGSILTMDQAYDVMADVSEKLGGILLESTSPDYKRGLALQQDLARILVTRTSDKTVEQDLRGLIVELDDVIDGAIVPAQT